MYTQVFIEKVEQVLGKNSLAAEHARSGSNFIGRILDDNSAYTISANEFLNLTHEEIAIRAKRIEECSKLYSEWLSGDCYEKNEREERMCPLMYLQNNDCDMKIKLEPLLCKDVKYFSNFYECQNWNCKEICWKKYYKLRKEM